MYETDFSFASANSFSKIFRSERKMYEILAETFVGLHMNYRMFVCDWAKLQDNAQTCNTAVANSLNSII